MYMRAENFKGVISIFILWAVFISLLIAIGVGYRARLELKSANFNRDKLECRILTWNGLHQAFQILKRDSEIDSVDSLNDNWCFPFDYQAQSGVCHVEVIDEERKININSVSLSLLARVFGSDFAQSLVDWRDEDEEPFLEYPYRNAPLRSLYELRYVKGGENLKPEQINRAGELFTIYGDGKLNINTVSGEVFDLIMTAYGLENIKEDIWRVRESGLYFTSLDNDYVAQFVYGSNFDRLSEDIKNSIQKLKNYFKVNSGYFRIYLVAETSKGTKKETLVVIERKGGFSILDWKENFWTQ